MPRPRNLNPKPKTYTVKQKLKNGGFHVLERTTVYDADKRQMKVISTRLIGKLPPRETDIKKMVPTNKAYSRNKKKTLTQEVTKALKEVNDTRRIECVVYPLDVVLLVVILAAISGFTSNYAIAEFWKAHRAVFEKYIKNFPQSDISHDTVRRIIQLLGGQDASKLLRRFTEPLLEEMTQQVIALDGQAVRAASKANERPRYALNVYGTDKGLCLNTVWIEDKENEITRAIEAISDLNLHGAVITCDALNTQKALCQVLIEKGADYCMALKANHALLCEQVTEWFKTAQSSQIAKTACRIEKGHGRIEEREVRVIPARIETLNRQTIQEWRGLEDGCFIKTTTRSIEVSTGNVRSEDRYFITSLAFEADHIAQRAMRCIRSHWQIENALHWCLDVTFNQDRTQCSNADYIKGRTVLTKIAFNFLSKLQTMELETSGKQPASKAMLKARYSNPEHLIVALAKPQT